MESAFLKDRLRSIMPQIMFQKKQIMLDSLRFRQGIEAQRVTRNGAVIHIRLFHNVAIEESLLEQIFKSSSLRIIHGVVRLSVGEYISTLWIV